MKNLQLTLFLIYERYRSFPPFGTRQEESSTIDCKHYWSLLAGQEGEMKNFQTHRLKRK